MNSSQQPSRLDVGRVLFLLNQLKREKIIPDFVVVGGVAALKYTEPRRTKDVDIVILVTDLPREYPRVWSAILERSGGQSRAQMIDIDGTWLDVLATGGDPFYEDALREAQVTRLFGTRVKVARPEHLIVFSLIAWRPDVDYSRIAQLWPKEDQEYLDRLLARYDQPDGRLRSRLAWLLRGTP